MVSTSKDHLYTPEDIFNADSGMAIAVVLWNDLDPSMVSLKIFSDEWGTNEEGDDYYLNAELNQHICTNEELGLIEGSPER